MGENGVSATTIHAAHVSILPKLTFPLNDSVFMALDTHGLFLGMCVLVRLDLNLW